MSNEGSKQSKGGKARAVRLDAETREKIATEGGRARATAAADTPRSITLVFLR